MILKYPYSFQIPKFNQTPSTWLIRHSLHFGIGEICYPFDTTQKAHVAYDDNINTLGQNKEHINTRLKGIKR